MLLPKGVLRLIMRYRLEAMIVDIAIVFKQDNPERTLVDLWIVDWYYTFNGSFELYKAGSPIWKYSTDLWASYLYHTEKL